MSGISRAMWGAALCGVLWAVGSGCSKPKEPPPGAPTDNTNALPTVDMGAGSGPSEGSTLEPNAGAGRDSRQPGISGEGQAPEEPGSNK